MGNNKFRFLLLVLSTFLLIALLYFSRDYIKSYVFFGKFDQLNNLATFSKQKLAEIEKQVNAPPPLVIENSVQESFLTKEGVIKFTNSARVQAGLTPLLENFQLNQSAYSKAYDMFSKQYFAHDSPEGKNVSDLASEAGYQFIVIGENLALGSFKDDRELVTGWMNSPGHRANILNPSYKEIGVAVIKGNFNGKTTWIAVQHFGRPLSDCIQPDDNLSRKIDENEALISKLKSELDSERSMLYLIEDKSSENYKFLVESFNRKVDEYNQLIEETKNYIREYNNQVNHFNQCISS